MADLSPLTYGRVVGRLLAIVPDDVDAGTNPDAVAPVGTVTFTPTQTDFVKVTGATPLPATAVLLPIVTTLDANGYITLNGNMGVWLVATNDPVVATAFTYTVTFDISVNGVVQNIPAQTLDVPAGRTVDLTGEYMFGPNLWTTKSFETGIGLNNVGVNASVLWGGTGYTGVKSLVVQANGISNNSYSAVDGDTGAMRVGLQAGKFYTVGATFMRINPPLTGTLHANARKIVVVTRIGAGSYVETASAAAPNVNDGGYSDLRVSLQIPVGATEAIVRLYCGSTVALEKTQWDDLFVTEIPSLSAPYTGPSSVYGANSPY